MRGAEPAHVEGREAARVGDGFGGECAQGPAASLLLLACSNHIAGGRAEVRLAASCICLAFPYESLSRVCAVDSAEWRPGQSGRRRGVLCVLRGLGNPLCPACDRFNAATRNRDRFV